jgi:hypothetical protein
MSERSGQYCVECYWMVRPPPEGADSIDDCNERAIQHHLETGHTVVSPTDDNPPSAPLPEPFRGNGR